ncbi:LamG domain-containing protein [bacterium]|nr:LamG domain-containing protein [bacterium]
MYTGPHLIKDNLEFGYDTGYGVADNNTATRFYPGEPTTNAVPLSTFINTSNWTGAGWSGAIAVSTDYDNTLELTSTNGWRTWRVNTGITSGGTVTVSYEYKMKTLATANVFMLNLNGDHLGSYVNGLGNISAADTQDLDTWKTFTSSWTANSNSNLAIGLRGADSQGLTDTIYVRNLQVELKGQSSPFTATSRSSTQSLIDLKKTTDINVSNISFDSTGQPSFDGTDDILNTGLFSGRNPATDPFSIEAIVKSDTTSGNHMWLDATNNGSSQRLYCAHASKGSNTPMGIQGSGWSHSIPQDTEFHHYVLVMDGSVARLYNNGELHSTKNYTSYTIQSINVGGRSGYRWVGKIPVFKIHNEIFTADKVKHNFNVYKNRFEI